MPANQGNFEDSRLKARIQYRAQTGLGKSDFMTGGLNLKAVPSRTQTWDVWADFFAHSNAKLVGMSYSATWEAAIATSGGDSGAYQGNRFDESGKDVTFVFQSALIPSLKQYLTIPLIDEQYFLPSGILDLEAGSFSDAIDGALDRLNDRPIGNLGVAVGPELGYYFVHALHNDGRGNNVISKRDAEDYAVEPGPTDSPGGDPDDIGGI